MKKIISFIGPNGVGKSTAAKNMLKIIQKYGKKAEIISFATPLKEIAKRNCGYDELKKREGHREILLNLGSDIREYLGDEVFSYACLDKISDMDVDYVIIDDMRWVQEAEVVSSFIPTYVIEIRSDCLIEPEGSITLADVKATAKFKKGLLSGGFTIHSIPNYEQQDNKSYLEEFFKIFDR